MGNITIEVREKVLAVGRSLVELGQAHKVMDNLGYHQADGEEYGEVRNNWGGHLGWEALWVYKLQEQVYLALGVTPMGEKRARVQTGTGEPVVYGSVEEVAAVLARSSAKGLRRGVNGEIVVKDPQEAVGVFVNLEQGTFRVDRFNPQPVAI